jgi:hypothetical protein
MCSKEVPKNSWVLVKSKPMTFEEMRSVASPLATDEEIRLEMKRYLVDVVEDQEL